jgi:LuxR family glucitol operon transcriptional activator
MILDNLETLSYDDPYLIKLVSQLPEGSKLLFTTRIGLGQYEQRFDLTALDKKTTEDIFIRYSRYLNISVSKINPKDIEKHCQNLFGNPLLIKWYLQNVKDGVDVSYLSKDGVSYIEAQKFCFKNIYNYYTKEQKTVLNILLVLNRPVALCEIMYYASKAGLHFDDVRRAFNPLNATGIFTVEKDSLKNYSLYSLTPFVKDYINNQCPTKELQDLFRSIQEVQKKLRASRQQDQVNTNNNKFLIERVSIRETDHVGLILRDELNTVFKLTDNKEALEKLNDLKNIFPSFSEIYRISGLIKTKLEDFMGARSDYERAVDLDPEDTLLLYTYAKFLAKEHSEDFQEALYYIDKVIEYEPREEWTLTSTRAEYLKMLGRYEEAKEIFLASIKDHNNNYTYDQVVDCFRRSAEQAANNGKADLFNTELTEAIHYLDKALSSEFYDKQTVVEKRLPKILGEMERHPRILSIETVDILKQLMKKHKGKMNSQLQTSFINFLMSYNSAMRKDGVTKPFSVNSKYTKTSSTYGKINANTY